MHKSSTIFIHDAIEAGFNKIVFIIRKDIKDAFKEAIGDRIEKICKDLDVEIAYAYQELNELPEGVELPAGRTKPWGTGQAVLACKEVLHDPPAVFDSNKSEILLSTENKLKEIYEVFPNEGKVVLGYSYLVSWNYVTWLDFPRPIDEELIPLFKKWIRKFPENKLELMEYYSFILFEKWLYMDSLDNISEANKIYYEIKAIADELSKDYADNQVTQMLSMGIVRKL